jgi:hypothetical protein
MNMNRWVTTAFLLAAFQVHAAGPLKPTFSFDEKSRDALVIVEVKPQKIVEEWQLSLNPFSLESKKFTGSVYKGISGLLQYVEGQRTSPRFFAGIVKRAGTHILYGLNTQRMWGACFDKGTQVFTFEPGKVYYLGVIDPNEGLARIATELPRESRLPSWVYGMWLSYSAPAQRKSWELDVAAFMAENLPKVKVPVLAAEGVEVSFTPGKAPAGNPVCRGNN